MASPDFLDRHDRGNSETFLWLAVACGAAARIWFSQTSGLYLDEAQVLSISMLPEASDLFRFLASHESHPPGYYLLIRMWQELLGGSNRSGIAFSLAAGVLLIPLTFSIVSRLLGSRRDGAVAAWLVALSPTAVRYSGMVRPYVILEALVLVAMFCLASFIQSGSWRAALGYWGSGTLMVYVHNWAWLVLAGLSLAAIGWVITRGISRRTLPRLVIANLLIGVAFLPWLGALGQQIAFAGHPPWPRSVASTVAESTWVLVGVPLPQAVLIGMATLLLSMIRMRAGVRLSGNRYLLVVMCLTTVLLVTGFAILLAPIARLLIPQCYAMLTPLVLVAVACVLHVDQLLSRRLAGGVLAVCLLASAGRLAVTSGWVRSDMREIGAFLTSRVAPEDLVLVYPDYPAPTLARYFVPPGEVFTYPRGGLPGAVPFDHRIARDEDTSGLAETADRAARAAAAGRRTWLVTLQNPPGYPPLKAEVERALRRVYGAPACVHAGTERPTLYEDMMVLRFEIPDVRAATERGGECR